MGKSPTCSVVVLEEGKRDSHGNLDGLLLRATSAVRESQFNEKRKPLQSEVTSDCAKESQVGRNVRCFEL